MTNLHADALAVNGGTIAVCAEGACPRCGGTETFAIPCRGRGPHHAERVCAGCGRHRDWVARPRDPAEAAKFPMPFGRHRGRPLGELDDGYFDWLTRTRRSRSVATRAELVLRERGDSR